MPITNPIRIAGNTRKLDEINCKLSLVDVCMTGFWWCKSCARITELEELNGGMVCAICQGPNIKHHPPVFTQAEHEFWQRTDRSRNVTRSRYSR